MTRAALVCMVLIGRTALLTGQITTSRDSDGVAAALAAYAVAHPLGVGAGHGPMSGLVIEFADSGWGKLLANALRQTNPAMWLAPAQSGARDQPHLWVRRVEAAGDSIVVDVLWRRCYGDVDYSGWPGRYTLRQSGSAWRVERAEFDIIAHGFTCPFDGGSVH